MTIRRSGIAARRQSAPPAARARPRMKTARRDSAGADPAMQAGSLVQYKQNVLHFIANTSL